MSPDSEVSVSVVMATCNGARYIPEQLGSIARQTILPNEVVIVDDASVDASVELVESFVWPAEVSLRFRSFDVRAGPSMRFSDGLKMARGAIVLLADQDDIWHPDKIEMLLEKFGEPDVMAACSDATLVDSAGKEIAASFWERSAFSAQTSSDFMSDPLAALLRLNTLAGNACAFRREVVSVALPIPAGAIHDYWLALHAVLMGEVRLVPKPLLDYRQHESNAIGAVSRNRLSSALGSRSSQHRRLWSEAALFSALSERLEDIPLGPMRSRAAVEAQIRAKSEHANRRQSLPRARWSRYRWVLGALLAGDYHRWSRGVPSAIADLWRPAPGLRIFDDE